MLSGHPAVGDVPAVQLGHLSHANNMVRLAPKLQLFLVYINIRRGTIDRVASVSDESYYNREGGLASALVTHCPMVSGGYLNQVGWVGVYSREDVRAGHQPSVGLCPLFLVVGVVEGL